jgi:glycosyltransferase involved in cell wall biosynthesis
LNSPLNIAVVGACPYPVPQGSQVYLRTTALALQHAGHRVHLVTYGYGLGEDRSGLPLHRAANVPGARRTGAGPSVAKPVQDALLAATLRRVIRDHAIDVINAHNYEALAIALAITRKPIVYHAHNALADELPHYFPNKSNAAALGRILDRALPRRADLAVAPHDDLAAYLIAAGCAADRVRTVPPPIDLDAFTPMPPRQGPATLVYAGNLDSYQNLDLLRPVVERVRAKMPGAELVVATAGPDSQRLMQIAEFARVVRRDSLADILRDLPSDAIFVCPRVSWSGYPIKLLNAMAAGLPIICAQSASHAFTAESDALVVPDNDADAFADAALRLLQDAPLRARLGAAARAMVETRHAIPAVAARLDAELRALPSRSA